MRVRSEMATLVAGATLFTACSGSPTQPTSIGAPATPVTASRAEVAALNSASLTAAELQARGWSCRPVPAGTGCVPPNQVVPSAALPPEDRPAVVTLLTFNVSGAFVGPATLVRADHYQGQTCESTGAPYTFFSLIGYYYCVRTAGA